ncbi:hypothetical protein ACFSS8_04090 [Paracoccus kondratievae]
MTGSGRDGRPERRSTAKETQNASSTPDEALLQHVAAHRPGRPGKIASDSELRAFVEARLSHMTFAEIEAAVTAQVAPFVQVPGLEGAIRFILAFGDAELYIGKNPRDTNELVQMFGRESAEAFANLATLSRRIPPRSHGLPPIPMRRVCPLPGSPKSCASPISRRTYLRREAENRERRRADAEDHASLPAILCNRLFPADATKNRLRSFDTGLTHDSGGGRAQATAFAAGSALPVESASLSHAQPCHGDAAQRYAFHLVSAHSSAGRPSSVNDCQTCASAY